MRTYLQISAVIICSLFSAVSVAGWFTDVSDDFLSSQHCVWTYGRAKAVTLTLTGEGYLIYKHPMFKLDKVSEDMILVRRISNGRTFSLTVEEGGEGYVGKFNGRSVFNCFD